MKDLRFDIKLNPQPTDTTCGPTCLHGIYRYLGDQEGHQDLIEDIHYTEGGGTLGVHLGIDALQKGFEVEIFTHNLNVFDPSWFKLSQNDLIDKLLAQSAAKSGVKSDAKTVEASQFYAEFLKSGGKIKFSELNPMFLYKVLEENGPVICGLSATYLYMSKREIDETCEYDDINGYPQGHFVVISGMLKDLSKIEVTDPLEQNPLSAGQKYLVDTRHFINSILIGVITYDANILTITKKTP